ncbi:hypothetical protein BBJ28_00022896, partial [Nothophytophthora sp. Chile5]
MCWWCCMRVLEKCLPRNDIVRELAPYLQHVHQEDGAPDDDTRRGGEPWVRAQSPRDEKNSATSSDSFRNNPNPCALQGQRAHSADDVFIEPKPPYLYVADRSARPLQSTPASAGTANCGPSGSSTIAAFQPHPDRRHPLSHSSNGSTSSPNPQPPPYPEGCESLSTIEVSGSEASAVSGSLSTKKSSVAKIKTDLGDLTPVRWDKVVLVQVSVQGFREMFSQAKELMEDAKLLYEHTVLSRLASEYGGQEVLSHSRSGLFVIAFASEFHAAKWCLSLQLSLVYAAWNDKLLRQFEDMKEVSVTATSGRTKKN